MAPFKKRTIRRTRRGKRPVRRRVSRRKAMPASIGTCKQLIMYDKFYTHLRFINTDTPQLPITLTPITQKQFILNGLFDVDPALATTDIPGFSRLGQLWSQYRAINCDIKCDFMNLNAQPIYCMLYAHTADDLFLPPLWGDFMELRGNKWVRFGVMEQTGSNARCTLNMKVNLGDLVGNRQLYRSNLNYEGQTASDAQGGANPSKQLLLDVLCLTVTSGGTFPLITPFHLELKWKVMFHDLAVMS